MIRPLMIVSGVVEGLVGLFCLVASGVVVELFFGTEITPTAQFLARLFGAAALSLGVAALFARNHFKTPGGLGIVYGLTAYNLLGAVVLAWASATGLGGAILLLTAVYHALMGAALVYAINAELGPWVKQG